MPPSKITQFFKKVPSKDLDAEKETSGGNSTRDSTTLPSVSHSTSKAEVSRPRSPAPPRPHDKSNAAQAIFIESDTSEDESNLNQGAKPRHQKNANRSKTIILDDDTDSETTMKNLSIRSPQKRRRLILDDEDDEVASASDIGTSTKTAEETQNNSSHGDDQVTESEGIIPSKRRLVRKRSETRHHGENNDNVAIDLGIFSDSQKSSDEEEEIQIIRKTRKTNVIRDDEEEEEDESGGEEWDVDKSAILEERTRVKKQSRYSEMLAVMKAGKQRTNEYSEDIPRGPLDRFTSTAQNPGTALNAEDFFSDTDDDHEHVESQDHDADNDDDEDEFVVADDMIDGVQVALSQQETHELPAEFSTKYQNNTEGYFHVYFEYLMYCIVDPAYGHADNIAISAVNRLIETCKDKVYSPVWKQHFTEDLIAWPSTDWKPIYQPHHDCDACMISGKGSTFSLTLFGSRYDEHCFPIQYEEPVQSSAILENVEPPNINHWLGYQKDRPRKDKYWLGSTCFNRAKIYHALVHLKFDLCTEIREFVRSASSNYGSEPTQPSHQNIDNLVDIMVETRLTDKFWALAKERVNAALYFRSDKAFMKGMNVSSFLMD